MTDPQEAQMPDLATAPASGVDRELLREAQEHLDAVTPGAAINEALTRLVRDERATRRAAREQLRQWDAEGFLDTGALGAADQ